MLTALRLLLGGVLVWASAAKLARPRDSAAGLSAVGVPTRLALAATGALATVEGALGLALLADRSPRAAAACAGLLGLAFCCVLLAAWRRGARRVRCACFGGRRERPLPLLVLRALCLPALAAPLVAGLPPASSLVPAALAVLGLAVLGLGALVLALYREVGVLQARLPAREGLELDGEGPALGAAAPPLSGLERRGRELVAFSSASCRLCRELEPGLRAVARAGIAVRELVAEDAAGAFERWAVPGTPYVVYVVDGLVVAKALVNTLEQLDWVIDLGERRLEARAAA
jgi:hypothetical protein